MELITIKEAGKRGPLTEWRLREMRKDGELPGVACGNRFYVNYSKLIEKLESDSEKNAGMGEK